jgi:chromate transporter
MAMKVAKPLVRSPEGLFVAALMFLAIALLRLPLLPTMLVLTPLSIALAWRRQRSIRSAQRDTVK